MCEKTKRKYAHEYKRQKWRHTEKWKKKYGDMEGDFKDLLEEEENDAYRLQPNNE